MRFHFIYAVLAFFVLTGCETFKGTTTGMQKDVDNTYENVTTLAKNVQESYKQKQEQAQEAGESTNIIRRIDDWMQENLW